MTARTRAILALLLIAPAPSVGVIVGLTFKQGALGVALWMAAKTWLFGLPAAWHLWVDRQRPSLSPVRHGGLGVGLGVGLAFMAVIFAAYYFVARSFIDPVELRSAVEPLGLTRPAVYIGAAIYWITVNSMLEEYVYRWFIFRKSEIACATGSGPIEPIGDQPVRVTASSLAAIVISAAVFVVHHAIAMAAYFPWWVNLLASAGIFIGGAAWSWLYLRYRSIWPCWIAHACADVPIFVIGYSMIFGG